MAFCHSAPPVYALPDGTNPKHVAVLTRGDWNRLHYQLNKKTIDKQRNESERAEKLAMREKSKAMISTWTNTLQSLEGDTGSRKQLPNRAAIEGARKKRLEERQKRLDAKEAEAKLVDIEEAKYQAEKRRDAIQKAKQLLYYQTDRVKEFHSALRVTEALKEREAQLEMKRLRELGMGNRDKEWHELAMRQKEEWDQQEAKKRENMRLAAMENTKDVLTQVKEKQSKKSLTVQEQLEEQERLIKMAEEFEKETEEKNRRIRDQRVRNMKANMDQIEEKRYLTEKERQQQEADDDEIRMYVNAKKTLLRKRADREAELEKEKKDARDRIYNKLTALHKAHVDDEQERHDKAAAEIEAREKREAEERRRRNIEGAAAAAEHLRDQRRRLEEARLKEKEQEDEMARMQAEADALYLKNEEAKSQKRREKAQELAGQYLQHTDERKAVEQREKEQAMAEALLNLELQLHEEDMFQQYAKSVIDNLEGRGRNTLPLRRVANKKPPIVMPTRGDEPHPDDGQPQPPSTYKRLGFVYAG